MRQLVSNLNNDSKMFLGDFDSYTIIRHGTTFDYLYNLSKVGLLLYDRILLPAAWPQTHCAHGWLPKPGNPRNNFPAPHEWQIQKH